MRGMTVPNRAKTTAKSTAGSYAEKSRSAPELSLAAAEVPIELDEALAHWGLAADDVPGIAEAWAERYGILDTEAPESAEAVAHRELELEKLHDDITETRVSRDGDSIIVTVTSDDDYDYETFRYVATGATKDRLAAALESAPELHTRWALSTERDGYIRGTRPVWHLLADPEELSNTEREVEERERAARRVSLAAGRGYDFREYDKVLREALETGDTSTIKKMLTVQLSPKDPASVWERDPERLRRQPMRLNSAFDTLRNHRRAQEKLTTLNGAMAEAQALPDGPLKELLLAERPEESYQTTEGTGRKKRTVTRTYRPRSELVKEHESAVKRAEQLQQEALDVESRLAEWRAEHEESIAVSQAAVAGRDAAVAALHQLGWPGDGPAPQRQGTTRA